MAKIRELSASILSDSVTVRGVVDGSPFETVIPLQDLRQAIYAAGAETPAKVKQASRQFLAMQLRLAFEATVPRPLDLSGPEIDV